MPALMSRKGLLLRATERASKSEREEERERGEGGREGGKERGSNRGICMERLGWKRRSFRVEPRQKRNATTLNSLSFHFLALRSTHFATRLRDVVYEWFPLRAACLSDCKSTRIRGVINRPTNCTKGKVELVTEVLLALFITARDFDFYVRRLKSSL